MWEWSHTEDAYAYAREQLDIMTSANLIELAKDWQDHLGERKFKPEELANATVFLCSERASYITGVSLNLDGGRLKGLW